MDDADILGAGTIQPHGYFLVPNTLDPKSYTRSYAATVCADYSFVYIVSRTDASRFL